jgi:hypothetical protein
MNAIVFRRGFVVGRAGRISSRVGLCSKIWWGWEGARLGMGLVRGSNIVVIELGWRINQLGRLTYH